MARASRERLHPVRRKLADATTGRAHGRRKRETHILGGVAGLHPDARSWPRGHPCKEKIARPRQKSLVEDIREILGLTDLDIRVLFGVVAHDRRRVGAALVDRDRPRNTMTIDGLAQEAQRRSTIPS